MFDVVTLGEAMIRHLFVTPIGLSSHNRVDLQTVGGAELNLAVGMAQLGRRAKWLSALGKDSAGSRILNEAEAVGVDTTGLIFKPGNPTGEYTVIPEEGNVTYQRSDSAFANLTPEDFKPALREQMRGARWLHLTGITPLLGEGPKGAWATALTWAELDGINISFDLNHRPALGEWEELWGLVEPRLRMIHLLTLSKQDLYQIHAIHDLDVGPKPGVEELVEAIRKRWLVTWVACTVKERVEDSTSEKQARWSVVAGPNGVVSSRDNPVIHQPVEALGGGDAWLASLIDGILSNIPLAEAASRADRYAAMVQAVPGDFSTIGKEMLDGDRIEATLNLLKSTGGIAILRGSKPDLMLDRGVELYDEGYRSIEVTLDSVDALATLQRLRAALPADAILGVGTVTDPVIQLPLASKIGATYCLAPNHPTGIIEIAEGLGMLAIPGASNPSEVESTISAGARAVKLFHASDDWGQTALAEVISRFGAENMVPVGGISPKTLQTWHEQGFKMVGLGEKLAGKGLK